MTIESGAETYCGLDVVKLLMAICVVAIHTKPLIAYQSAPWYYYYQVFLSLAVPFFFMASSFLLFKKYYGALENAPATASIILTNYIKRFVRLYFLWSLIHLPLTIVGYYLEKIPWWRAILSAIKNLLVKGGNFYSWQLWFLLSSIYAAIVVSWLLKRKWKQSSILFLSFIVYFVGKYISSFVANIDSYSGTEFYIAKTISLVIYNGRCMSGILFFALGMYFADKPKLLKLKWYIALGIFMLSSAVFYFCPCSVSKILLFCSFFVWVINWRFSPRPLFLLCRKLSISIYFLHLIGYAGYTYCVGLDNRHGVVGFAVAIAFSIIIHVLGLLGNYIRNYRATHCKNRLY